jgi:hypothetical protein
MEELKEINNEAEEMDDDDDDFTPSGSIAAMFHIMKCRSYEDD